MKTTLDGSHAATIGALGRSRAAFAAAIVLASSCSAAPSEPTGDAGSTDASDDVRENDDSGALDGGGSDVGDAGGDSGSGVLPPLTTHSPVSAPADPLASASVESCAIYLEERCEGTTLSRCRTYDPTREVFVDPDELLQRVLLYDRWYDLHHQPLGQTAERLFSAPMPAGTPEQTWADPANFGGWAGLGDAGIWNGAALTSRAMRYAETGTQADYERMEQKVRDMLLQFDVTGVPGYLSRYHYLEVPDGAPLSTQIPVVRQSTPRDHRHRRFDPNGIADLPSVYTEGWRAPDGTVYEGTPMFNGHPSIDQYTGARIGLPLAHGLLRDASLKRRIEEHLTCYLKRLQRIEIVNLQQNQDAVAGVTQYFTGSGLVQLDPDDVDLTQTDTIVAYVHPMLNSLNEDNFDRSCPSNVQLEPVRTIDAAADNFLTELLKLVTDLNSKEVEKTTSIDHIYVPNVRGADAIHMMHLAATAYHFTGEEQYRRFLFEELIGELGADDVALTAGAFNLPRFCRAFYGHHIGFTPAWAFMTMLDDSPLKTRLQTVFEVEMWQKEMRDHRNALFEVMYLGVVPEPIAQSRSIALARATDTLRNFGGNGGILADPRRTYHVDRTAFIGDLPDGNTLRCPTAEEVAACEDGFTFLGLSLPGEDITSACTGAAWECPIEGQCATAQTANPLPPTHRNYADFAWQRNPYTLPGPHAVDGAKQSPGLDLTEAYWIARHYGLVVQGEGLVLGWEPVGDCQP